MRKTRVAGQALRLAADSPCHAYICRACLAQSSRQLSTSSHLSASSEPFFKRIQNSLFGSKESKAADAARELARKQQLERIKKDGPNAVKETLESRKGRVFEFADHVDPTTHQDYVVSRTWKGLERIGGPEWVRERADAGEVYEGFMPAKKAKLEVEEWASLLHSISTDVLVLKKSGGDVMQICNPRTSDQGGPEREPGALEAELKHTLMSGRSGNIYVDMKLDDPRVKFAILKRTMQLTGNRVPDILISNAKTLGDLLSIFAAKEAPKKLYDTEELQALQSVENITVHESRRTHVHRDKAIGRWKLIEDEMNVRGMPTRGGSNLGSSA